MTTTAWPPAAGAALPAPAHEHEFEAAHGLPEALPAGERPLWQGRPDAWALARDALHLRLVLGYFGLLAAWRLASALHDGAPAGAALMQAAGLLAPALLAAALLGGIAALMARTTVYTVTDRRVVMRVGIVLTVTYNLPFTRIAGVALRARGRDGAGDLAISLADGERIAYLHLWPHARPWHVRQVQPMLRALPDAVLVGRRLADALRAAQQAHAAAPATDAPGADEPAGRTPAAAGDGRSLPRRACRRTPADRQG